VSTDTLDWDALRGFYAAFFLVFLAGLIYDPAATLGGLATALASMLVCFMIGAAGAGVVVGGRRLARWVRQSHAKE